MRNLFVICMMAGYASSALANQQQGDSWSLTTNIGQSFDDNLFRINDEARLQDGLYRSDWLTDISLGGNWSTNWSRQKIYAATSLSRQEYERNEAMSNTAHQLEMGWQGAVGSWLNSGVTLLESQKIGSFEDVQVGTKDMQNQRRMDFLLSNPSDRLIALELTGELRTLRHSSQQYQPQDVDEMGWGGATGIRSHRGSKVSLIWQDKQINYRQASTAGSNYREQKLKLVWRWPVTERLGLQGELGRMFWRYDDRDDKQFTVGAFGINYMPTEKSTFDFKWSREEAPAGERYRSVIDNTYNLSWKWQWTPIWALNQSISRAEADYQETDTGTAALGQERTYGYQATLTWHPARNWTGSLFWKWGSRESQLHSREYDYQNAGVNLSYTF